MAKYDHNKKSGKQPPAKQAGKNNESQPGLEIGLSEEECQLANSHPEFKKIVGYLAKGQMDGEKQQVFERMRSGAKHQAFSDAMKELSDKLWGIIGTQKEILIRGAKAAASSIPSHGVVRNVRTQATNYDQGAEPSILGESFHNPYTFIPFGTSPQRHSPTPQSIGDVDFERHSGLLELKIATLSPLLSCSPTPLNDRVNHKSYTALTIQNDVIVPATGIRGSLRTLMTILTGGTLGYVDQGIYLAQERDVPLGPRGKNGEAKTPVRPFLAEVVSVGTAHKSGQVRLGQTLLVKTEKLERRGRSLPRPSARSDGKVEYLWANAKPEHGSDLYADVVSLDNDHNAHHPWKVKLSGRPVGESKSKKEGLFLASDEVIELPPSIWEEYQGRNRHAAQPQLKVGDLVWLQPDKPDRLVITEAGHIKSLQWARWGRAGERLLDLLKEHHSAIVPDSLRNDGLVDEVTDLFGHVPEDRRSNTAPAFAARIRLENLVFFDAKSKVQATSLAPLSSPHPGCYAFYRDCDDVSDFGPRLPLRGYKVYRNTNERGENAPWLYGNQAIFENGRPKDKGNPEQNLNKTCQLLPEGETGFLRISFRDLSKRELALLVLACSVDWRLGGGKPFGLGHCRVIEAHLVDEQANRSEVFKRVGSEEYPPPADIGEHGDLVSDLNDRIRMWHESQRPVAKLRYPRAAKENKNKKVEVGGHVWFVRHAGKRKGVEKRGLEVTYVADRSELSQKTLGKSQIRPQSLPIFNPEAPGDDQLYGYDLHEAMNDSRKVNNQTMIGKLEPYDPDVHVSENYQPGENQSPNRDSRNQQKQNRRDS